MRRLRLLPLALVAVACGGSPKNPASHQPSPETAAAASTTEQKTTPSEEAEIAAIAAAINEYSGAIHTCWAMGAADDFHLEGRVVLSLEVGAEGKSEDVEVVSDEPGDPALTECLVNLWRDHRWPDVFAAGDKIQLPPFSFVAPDAQYTVAEAHARSYPLGKTGSSVKVLLDEKNTGNSAASMSLFNLVGGIEVPMHRHTSAELLFVFSGEGTVFGLAGAKKGTPVTGGSVIYIPAGTAHGFRQTGEAPVVVLQLYAPGGPEARFKGGAATGTTPVSEAEKKRHPRKFPKPLVRPVSDAEALPIAGGVGEVRIVFDKKRAGDAAAYIGALTAGPGMKVPPHKHAAESEYLFIIEGQGTMTVAGDEIPVQSGDAIEIPPGVEHSFGVTGEGPVKAVQFYTPSGPEQRFKGAH